MEPDLKTELFDYMGGINMVRNRTNYPKTEALKAINMRFHRGKAARRYGDSKFNDNQMANAGNVLGLHDYRYGASGQLFIEVENTVMYKDNGTARTSIKTGLTAGEYPIFENFDSYMWWVNGTDTPLKFDGTTVTNASIATPAVGSFAAATGDPGDLTGTYYYLVTFYVSATGQESQPFTIASAPSVSPSSEKVDLSAIPVSSDSQVTHRRIYRTAAGGSPYNARLLTTINDNSTTTYEDNIADSALGDLIELNHDPMPTLTKIVKHNDRFFGFEENSSRLYVSRQFNVWYWPQGLIDLSDQSEVFYIDIEPDDGDKITNIVSYFGMLIVFKYDSIHVIEGYDFYKLTRRKIPRSDKIGCVGKRAAGVAPDGWLYFIDKNGVHRTNILDVQYQDMGEKIEGFFDKDNPDTDIIVSGTYLKDAIVHLDNTKPNNNLRFAFCTGTKTVNNITVVYNYIDSEWEYDTGYNTQSLCTRRVNGKDVLMRGDDYGYVWACNQLQGDGATINGTAEDGNTLLLIDTDQDMDTDAYKGCYIEILSGTGTGQRRKITSNNAIAFNVTGDPFDTAPDSTSVYTVGGIDGQYIGPYHNYGNSLVTKNLSHVLPKIASNGNYSITMIVLYDFQSEDTAYETDTLEPQSDSVWGTAIWDISRWDRPSLLVDLIFALANNLHRFSAVGFKHKKAGQGFTVYGYDKLYMVQGFGIR